jgi:tetratricopeptide (TPR) repeat protein
MRIAGITGFGVGFVLAVGVVCTTLPAYAAGADDAVVKGQTLRRSGKENDALTELRRAKVGATGAAATKIDWEIARTHIAKRDFASAMSSCRSMAKEAPAASRVCAAEAHLLWRRGTEAMNELAELAKIKDAPADVRYFGKVAEGRAQELASKEADAEAAYKKAIETAGDRPEAHALLGAMQHRLGKDGVPELRKAVDLDAKDPFNQHELGRALATDPAKIADAITAFERAVAERPGYTEALRSLTEAYLTAKRVPDAKRTAETVLKTAPNDVYAHIASGRVALAENRLDDALKEGETAVKLMPNEAKGKLLIADAYAKKGEIDLALEAYQSAAGLDHGDATPLVNAGRACLDAGRPTSAKAFGIKATKEFPNHARAWVLLGDALVVDKDVPSARNAYETAKKQRDANAADIDAKLTRLRDARPQS